MIERSKIVWLLMVAAMALASCAQTAPMPEDQIPVDTAEAEYIIGPGDTIQVFVWRSPEFSTTVPVRPDGKITTPLVEDLQAVGKTPSQLARDIEAELSEFLRSPNVTVIVTGFVDTLHDKIRVVGQAAKPQALEFRPNMTVLDVMIGVGGLGEFAAGNRAKIARRVNGQMVEIPVRLDDLLNKGEIAANIRVMPGDVLIIPQSRF